VHAIIKLKNGLIKMIKPDNTPVSNGDIEINKILIKKSKAKKYIEGKNIIKTIFVKNKIINYIVKD